MKYDLGSYANIREIWRSMAEFRNYTVRECLGCDKFEVCRGGCRVFAEKFGNGIFWTRCRVLESFITV